MSVTNQTASVALRGQAVTVTLNPSDALSALPNITLGEKATVGSTSLVGYVSSIDSLGMSFKVSPRNPDLRWDSTATGYLSVSETITLG